MIYFDNAATTQALDSVAAKMQEMMCDNFANPASVSVLGLRADKEVRKSSQIISRGIHCKEEEIYFTSGGTEGDNWAIFGTAAGYVRNGKHMITTQIEHPAVKNAMKSLEEQGYEVTWLPVNKEGQVDLEALKQAIRKETVLVSIILINNETGAVQPVEEIGKIIKEKNGDTLFHVDAVQAFGKYPIDVQRMKIDLLTMSGHKIHGPKGVGVLYLRNQKKVKPYIIGGGQQRGQRAGTENTSGAAALGVAAEEAFLHLQDCLNHVMEVKKTLYQGIIDTIPEVRLNGNLEKDSPYVLNVTFAGVRSEVLLHALEEREIYVSAGSACDSKKKTHSSVLQAMGYDYKEIEGTIRFSFSRFNTIEEAKKCVMVLQEVIPMLRKYNR